MERNGGAVGLPLLFMSPEKIEMAVDTLDSATGYFLFGLEFFGIILTFAIAAIALRLLVALAVRHLRKKGLLHMDSPKVIHVPAVFPKKGNHVITLEVPIGEGPLDVYNAFQTIYTNLAAISDTQNIKSLPGIHKNLFDGSRNLAAYWLHKLQKYG